MKRNARVEMLGLAMFTGLMAVMVVSGQSTSAASSTGGSCMISFSGSLASLEMAPAGVWRMTSSGCSVTDQSGGITQGTFTGTLDSNVFNGTVSGTWSVAGSTQKVVASSTEFTLSFSTDQGVDKMPVLGSAYQGTLSGTGSGIMLTVATVGQISLR